MRRSMVAGNWKMHGTRASVAELIDGLNRQALPADVAVAVFPVSVHLGQVVEGLKGVALSVGAQDCAVCLLYTSPSPRDVEESRMPSSA